VDTDWQSVLQLAELAEGCRVSRWGCETRLYERPGKSKIKFSRFAKAANRPLQVLVRRLDGRASRRRSGGGCVVASRRYGVLEATVMAAKTGIDQIVRSVRGVHSAFMGTVLLYVYMMHAVQRSPPGPAPVVFWSIAGVAGFCWVAAYMWRARRLSPAAERLKIDPNDGAAQAKWRSASIVSVAMIEAVVLFGYALYLLGATAKQVAPFLVIPFVTMGFWFPRRP
jgi:hypothetical protein